MSEEINKIKEKLEWLLPEESQKRVTMKGNDYLIVYADIHKMGCREAGNFVSNLIALIRKNFTLRIVHGFNGGTALKEMFQNRYENNRILDVESPDNNPGITDFIVAE